MPPCPPGAHFGTAGSPRALFAVPFSSAAGSRMSSERSQALEPLLAAGLLRGSAAAHVLSPVGPPCVLPGFAQPARSRHALAGDAFCSVRGISSRARSPGGAELCLSGRLSSQNEASLRVLAGGLAAAAGGEAAGEEARPRRAARAALQRPGVAQHVVPGACLLAAQSLPAPGGAGLKPLGHQHPQAVVPTWVFFPLVEPQPSLGTVVFLLPASSICV